MEPVTIGEILAAVDGTLMGIPMEEHAVVTSVTTDSRAIQPGSLFIPLSGDRYDGHAFIQSALEHGAAGCLFHRDREHYLPGKFYIKVRSTHRALRDLAQWYKRRFDIPFVCVTGSVGKTTTKDMIAAVLGERFRVLKTDGNFNNDIGLPLTLLRLEQKHQICVLEMGMNHAGEIEYLSELVEPDVAVITNVGDAHMENLGSREGIFRAKCEIFSHMKAEGLAILNGDDEWLKPLRDRLPFSTLLVGTGDGMDYRADEVSSDGRSHLCCRISTPAEVVQADIPALGTHMIYPAMMAAAVASHFGMSGQEISRGMRAFLPTKMRMNILRLPQSMRAAAAVLGDAQGRRVAIVGDMLELGDNSALFHQAVGSSFGAYHIHCVIAIGVLSRHIADGARDAGVGEVYHFESKEDAMPIVLAQLRPGATILVKASRRMAFEELAAALVEAGNSMG